LRRPSPRAIGGHRTEPPESLIGRASRAMPAVARIDRHMTARKFQAHQRPSQTQERAMQCRRAISIIDLAGWLGSLWRMGVIQSPFDLGLAINQFCQMKIRGPKRVKDCFAVFRRSEAFVDHSLPLYPSGLRIVLKLSLELRKFSQERCF
jgi:hypothetical protein